MSHFFAAKTTRGGYKLGDCISALQKEIRRSNEEAAMYWAIEIESIEPTYLWNRLAVIASEDIGLASPQTLLLVDTLQRWYESAHKRKNGSRHLFLGNAILAMCRCPKSRLTDDFVCATYMDRERREIPDYAYDKHTYKGRAMGRDFDHFFEEGAKVEPEANLPGQPEYRERTRRYLAEGRAFKHSAADTNADEETNARLI